jgi:hypothetical protein
VAGNGAGVVDEALYQAIKTRLMGEAPQLLKVLATRPELVVEVTRQTVTADGSSTKGRVARLIAHGFLKDTRRFAEVLRELERTGTRVNNRSLAVALHDLVVGGFMTKEGSEGYVEAPGAHVRIVEA